MGWDNGAHQIVKSPNIGLVWALAFAAVYKSPSDAVYVSATEWMIC